MLNVNSINPENNKQLKTNDEIAQAPAHSSILPRMLPIKEVCYYTGLGQSTIYNLLDKKSDYYDPSFPERVTLTKGRVAWIESEIAEWINSKIAKRSV